MKISEVDKALDKFYMLYETKCWSNEELEVVVEMINNSFMMALVHGDNIIDAMLFSYEDSERSVYKYMMVKLFLMFLGNVMIYQNDKIFFNEKHKNYLSVLVLDSELLDIFTELRITQDDLDKRDEIVNRVYGDVPMDKRYTSLEFDECLKGRYYISSKKLSKKI